MRDDVRPDVLDRIRAEYAELAARMHADVLRMIDDLELNRAEKLCVAVELAGAAVGELQDVDVLREPPGLLELNRHEVDLIVERGLGLMWLVDQLGYSWSTRPDTPLVDVLKVEPGEAHRVPGAPAAEGRDPRPRRAQPTGPDDTGRRWLSTARSLGGPAASDATAPYRPVNCT